MIDADLVGQTLTTSDPARDIQRKHEGIRRDLESALGNTWRIMKIRERSVTSYKATLDSRMDDHPDYVLVDLETTYEFEAIEDGPRDQEIDCEIVVIPRPRLYGEVRLTAKGRLCITAYRLAIPS